MTIEASIVPTEAGNELFGNYYHGWFLDVYGSLVASQREWKVVKGAAQDWALKDEEGAHVVRDGSAVDLSGLIVFDDADARLDDYTPVYTVKDAAGNTIFTGVDAGSTHPRTGRVHRRDRAGKRPLRSVRCDADLRVVSLR